MTEKQSDFEIPVGTLCGTMGRLSKSTLYERFKQIAKDQNMSVHSLIELAIKRYVLDKEKVK